MSEKKDYEKQTFGLSTDLIDYLIMIIMTVTDISNSDIPRYYHEDDE